MQYRVVVLGTGAVDWTKPSHRSEFRGYSSVLVDRHILIDCCHASISKMEELEIDLSEVSDVLSLIAIGSF